MSDRAAIERLRAFDAFYEPTHRRIVVELMNPNADAKVLDVGCGAGGMSILICEALTNGILVALDSNAQHLQTTRTRAQQAGCAQRMVCALGDVEKLNFLASEFDVAWCSRVIHHHLTDPYVALSELYRVLRPGGRLFLRENANTDLRVAATVPTTDAAFWRRLCNAQQQWFQSKFKRRRPTSDEWSTALQQVGFRDTQVVQLDYIPAGPRAQVIYLRHWLESILEDHASPEYGDLFNHTDLMAVQDLLAWLDGYLQRQHGVTEIDPDVSVTTEICVGVK
jgi:ubiquinone/menaquinone biosynthesis C-methylase UbiE